MTLTMRDEDFPQDDEVDWAAQETTLRAALDATFRGSGVNLVNAKLVHESALQEASDPEQARLVRLYADLMKIAAPAAQR